MKQFVILTAGFVMVCMVIAAPLPKYPVRKLGPEWKKLNEDGREDHVRKIELTQWVQERSNYLHTRLPLEDYHRDLYVTEGLNWEGRTLAVRLSGVEDPPDKKKDKKTWSGYPDNQALLVERTEGKGGKVVKHFVELGRYRHFDVNGDGRFDVVHQEDDPAAEGDVDYWFILLPDGDDYRLLRVWDMRLAHTTPPLTATSYADDTDYKFDFDKGQWRQDK